MVRCDVCGADMKQPPDPFEGPNVVWGKVKRWEWTKNERAVFYVCSPVCHEKQQAKVVHEPGFFAKRKPGS